MPEYILQTGFQKTHQLYFNKERSIKGTEHDLLMCRIQFEVFAS